MHEEVYRKEARIVLDTAYGLAEEHDNLVRVTEEGLLKAIAHALSAAFEKGRKEK